MQLILPSFPWEKCLRWNAILYFEYEFSHRLPHCLIKAVLRFNWCLYLTYNHKWIEKSIALCGGSYMLVKDTQNVLNVVASKHHLCFMQQFYVIASSRRASLSLYMSRVFISPLTFKQWSQIISAWLNRGNPLVRFLVECHDIIYK